METSEFLTYASARMTGLSQEIRNPPSLSPEVVARTNVYLDQETALAANKGAKRLHEVQHALLALPEEASGDDLRNLVDFGWGPHRGASARSRL